MPDLTAQVREALGASCAKGETMGERKVHLRVVERGEYGTVLSSWPLCTERDERDGRYHNAPRLRFTNDRAAVTCELCLAALKEAPDA